MVHFTRKPRYLEPFLKKTRAARKMVFVGGPRQVGKTTLAIGLLGERADERHPAYLSWDDPRVRPRLRRAELPSGAPLIVCDEIHKYARWRNLIKGTVAAPVEYFAERTPIPRFFQVHRGQRDYESGKVRVLPFVRFCKDLGMP